MAKKNETEEKTVVKEKKPAAEQITAAPELASDFEYRSVGNVPYDFDKEALFFSLKAQVPFRLNHDDVRMISTGLKVRIPDGYIGLILNSEADTKAHIEIVGSPVILTPSIEEKEIFVNVKMLGYGYKIYKMGDEVARLLLIKTKPVKSVKK